MSRPRSRRLRDLPPNLSESKPGYYTWRDPITGRKLALGRDKRSAITQAVEANLHVSGLLTQARLIDRLTGDADRTVSDLVDRHAEKLADRALQKSTRETNRQRLETIREKLGGIVVSRISTVDVADFLKDYEDQGKKRSAQAFRSLLLDLFRTGKTAGWIKENPVTDTSVENVKVKRARLTWPDFQAIYEQAKTMHPWVARSIELALVTAQRREDVREMGFRDARESMLWVDQGKTGARIRIPLSLRLDAIGLSIDDVIKRCRDSAVSQYLVHHVQHIGRAKPGSRVRLQSITGAFAEARDLAKAKAKDEGRTDLFQWKEGGTPPTFHELRSLSERLYREQGIDTQALLGHKSPTMTSVYNDVRGADWIDVKIA